jgi:pSer/pThr/pTyr-binding forkhead associated (FHA) protein
MPAVTFQVLEGVDKGRVFRQLPTPVTIGREEGNVLRLNDERVSRFHAKIQADAGDIILTDLESTNGTKVNGNMVQIRRLRLGDRITLGRSQLLFGSEDEIDARRMSLIAKTKPNLLTELGASLFQGPATVQTQAGIPELDPEFDFDLDPKDIVSTPEGEWILGKHHLPPLPNKMTPAQAARFAEVLEFLHRGLILATEQLQADDDGTQVTLHFADWQRILNVQMLLARYLRAITDPDTLSE